VLENQLWIPSLYVMGTSQVLSSTILPTYFVNLAGIDLTVFLKFIYPFLFAFVPVGLYEMFSKISNKSYALIGVYFFIFQITFFTEMTMLLKQGIAEIFFIAVLICIFTLPQLGNYHKYLIPIFFFGIIASHYGFAFFFLLYMLLGFVISRIILENKSHKDGYFSKSFLLIYVLLFSAYLMYIALGPLHGFVEILMKMLEEFQYSFLGSLNPFGSDTRDLTIVSLLDITNQTVQMSAIRYINAMIVRVTYLLIILGSMRIFVDAFRNKENMNQNYIVFILVSFIILLLAIVVPFFSQGLDMTRTFHITLYILAITIPYGIQSVVEFLSKGRKNDNIIKISSICLVILFFVFQTGLVSLVFNQNSSVVSEVIDNPAQFYGSYIHDSEKYGAEWISANRDDVFTVSSDSTASQHVLTSYGDMLHPEVKYYGSVTSGYLYLRNLNINYHIMPTINNFIFTSNPLEKSLIPNNNLIYNNGYSSNLLFQ
jgi:uncharacterized membrane protein